MVAMSSRRELEDLEYRYYNEMKDGTRKVKISDSVFRCPFCYRDQNRDYQYENLLHHASRIGGSSHTKDVRERARHLALERYMRRYLRPLERPDPTATSDIDSGPKEELYNQGNSSSFKAEPKSVPEDDLGQSGEERRNHLQNSNSASVSEAMTNPAKRSRLSGSKEGEGTVQQVGFMPGSKFAPKFPHRDGSSHAADRDQMYVHPWKGILANVKRTFNEKDGKYAGESGSKIREELTSQGFNPQKVQPLWNFRLGHTGFAIVDFGKEWEGFTNAIKFDNHFEVNQCGRRAYDLARDRGDKLYGWIAREDDYNSRNIIGDNLRKQGDLKSVSGKREEDQRKALTLVSTLTNTLETRNTSLEEIKIKYNETSRSLEKTMKEKDTMIKAYNEKMSRMQQEARDYMASIYQEHEKASQQLESQKKEYEEREKYLDKCQLMNKTERRKLQWQKQKNLMATQEQQKADEDMMRLAEQQQREKEEMHRKVHDLEHKLDAKQELELEIERLRSDLQVLSHMPEEEDADTKKMLETTREELKEKEEEWDYQESLYQTLVVKHGYTNDELQDARKALIQVMGVLTTRADIRVKKMGELDEKPFKKLAKEKYPAEEADLKAAELSSLWEDYLRDSGWHPFKVIAKDGTHVEVLNEEDEKLQGLRKDMGDEVFEAVRKALCEMNEYNGSGRYIVPELWNFREGRKASLKEGVTYLLRLLKSNKPKQKRR